MCYPNALQCYTIAYQHRNDQSSPHVQSSSPVSQNVCTVPIAIILAYIGSLASGLCATVDGDSRTPRRIDETLNLAKCTRMNHPSIGIDTHMDTVRQLDNGTWG